MNFGILVHGDPFAGEPCGLLRRTHAGVELVILHFPVRWWTIYDDRSRRWFKRRGQINQPNRGNI